MPRYLLDTNICIYIARHKPAVVRERFARHPASALAMSVVTLGELRFGAARSQAPAQALAVIDGLCRAARVLELPVTAGAHYGDIRATLQREGRIIGNNDLWLAAHARAGGLIMVTANTREFERVPGLVVEDWSLP